MSTVSSRTGNSGGTRTGSRAASASASLVSAATSLATAAISSATRNGGHDGATQSSNAASATSTSTGRGGNGNNTAQDASRTLQRWMMTNYPLFQWWLIGAMGGFLALLYLGSLVRGYLRRQSRREHGSSGSSAEPKDGEVIQAGRQDAPSYRNIIPALSTIWYKTLYRVTIPTSLDRAQRINLGEAIFCAGYLASCMMFGFINSESGPNSFANRTGWLAYAQTPFIVGLAGKNNVISFLTGIGPEKLNVLHRTAGRAVLILSLAHTFAWVYIGLGSKHAIYTTPMIWGAVAMVSFFATWLLSFRFIRRLCYEFFLVSHIILICFFLAGCIMHKKSAAYWIYPSFALWASDRLARMTRMLLLNRLWLSAVPSSLKDYTHATVHALTNETVKITMKRKMTWRAGQHAYLVLPGVSRLPWEAHPFTIASAPTPRAQSSEGKSGGENELTFIVRVRDGFTRRLLSCAANGGGEGQLVAFVDGPYGMPPDLLQYQTVVLIAGGSGISYTLAQLSHIVQYHPIRAPAVQRVCFVWIARQYTHLSWATEPLIGLLRTVPTGLEIVIKIFVTGTTTISADLPILSNDPEARPGLVSKDSTSSSVKSGLSSTDLSGSSTPDQPLARFSQVTIQDGRPDLQALLQEQVNNSQGPVSVDVCGPESLSRTVRSLLRRKEISSWSGALKGRPEVELHVEQFGCTAF